MKKIILILTLLVTTAVVSQNNLFDNVSEKDQYQEYTKAWDKEGDGTYKIGKKRFIVNFKIERLSTGEGYSIAAVVAEGEKKGKKGGGYNVIDGYYECSGYPYESVIRHKYKKDGIVAIGDYVFVLDKISKDGTSFQFIDDIYVKIKGGNTTGKKKKKSFFQRLKEAKNKSKKNPDYGAEHKALQSKNLKKLITDYLVAMKAKQNARTAKEKQGDKNIIAAKNKGEQDIKRYNDSIKATPEYKDLQRRKRLNETNYQGAKAKNTVTLRNNSSRTIYVGTNGSRNPGTKISAGGTASWNCDRAAYLQKITKSGGSNAYSSTNRLVYRKNSGCGKTININ